MRIGREHNERMMCTRKVDVWLGLRFGLGNLLFCSASCGNFKLHRPYLFTPRPIFAQNLQCANNVPSFVGSGSIDYRGVPYTSARPASRLPLTCQVQPLGVYARKSSMENYFSGP
jgi:hypothetical protein